MLLLIHQLLGNLPSLRAGTVPVESQPYRRLFYSLHKSVKMMRLLSVPWQSCLPLPDLSCRQPRTQCRVPRTISPCPAAAWQDWSAALHRPVLTGSSVNSQPIPSLAHFHLHGAAQCLGLACPQCSAPGWHHGLSVPALFPWKESLWRPISLWELLIFAVPWAHGQHLCKTTEKRQWVNSNTGSQLIVPINC